MERHVRIDPGTGEELLPDAIQRELFQAERVHVYAPIPPMASMRGHESASWTQHPELQTHIGPLRVLETSSASPPPSSSASRLRVDVVLDNPAAVPATADSEDVFFAVCPYTDASAVEHAADSARFFALTVRQGRRKAVLGIGFEDRDEALAFVAALQGARRTLGWETAAAEHGLREERQQQGKAAVPPHKDYSLKAGETITVNIGGRFGRRRKQEEEEEGRSSQSFALPPQSSSRRPEGSGGGGGGGFALPPPPRAQDVKSKRRSLMALGFDDGQFGEFA